MLDDLRRWLRYHIWANHLLRAAAAELPADALHRELGGPGVGALGMCLTGGFAPDPRRARSSFFRFLLACIRY